MKQFLPLLLAITMIFLGCGDGTKNTAAEKKADPKKEVKKELIVTLNIGEEVLKFNKVRLLSDARTPADKTTKYTLYVQPVDGDVSVLDIEFDSAIKGKVQEAYISLKNYSIIKSEFTLESFEIKNHMLLSTKATFSGQLKMHNTNGFTTGDLIDFTGTFVK